MNITLNKMKKVLLSLSLALSFGLSQAQTAFEIIQNSPNHNTLEAAVLAAGLDGALNTLDPITVFAPTDDAFNALPAGTVAALLNDIPALTDILLYHVINGAVLSTDLTDGQIATTLNGSDITVTINNGVFINGTSQVIVADVAASNGVVHVVNEVLSPAAPQQFTIWDVIQNSPDHTTLEAVVGLAGLDGALDSPGAFTVFAPTDAAFGALPAGTIESLIANPTALTNVLLYHAVGSEVPANSLVDGQNIEMLQGDNTTITLGMGGAMINNANIVAADLNAWNGIIHVIDAVLLPPASINDILNSAVQAYPNPCTDVLTIERKSASAETYSIYNVSGQLVASGLLNNNLNTISTNAFTSGMYSVVTESGSHFNFIKN